MAWYPPFPWSNGTTGVTDGDGWLSSDDPFTYEVNRPDPEQDARIFLTPTYDQIPIPYEGFEGYFWDVLTGGSGSWNAALDLAGTGSVAASLGTGLAVSPGLIFNPYGYGFGPGSGVGSVLEVTETSSLTVTADSGYSVTATITVVGAWEIITNETFPGGFVSGGAVATYTVTARDDEGTITATDTIFSDLDIDTWLSFDYDLLYSKAAVFTLTPSGIQISNGPGFTETYAAGEASEWAQLSVASTQDFTFTGDGDLIIYPKVWVTLIQTGTPVPPPVTHTRLPLRVMQRGDGRAGGTARWAVGAGRCTPSGTRANGVR